MTALTSIRALATALAAYPLATLPALAQSTSIDTAPVETNEFGEFIGTILIGESRRGVQTDTATPETIISADELEQRQASTLAEVLDTIPGVTLVNGSTPQGSAVNIRGLGSQAGTYGADGKVAVVIDGVQKGQEEIYRAGGLLTMEPELFKEVSVTRGPAESFRYSSGAIGGTIEAQTKDAADFLEGDDTFALRQKVGYESNGDGFLTTTILAFRPTEKFDFIAFAGYRDVGDRTDGSGTVQADTAFALPSTLLKGTYRFSEELSVTASLSYTENDEQDVSYDAYSSEVFWPLVDRYTKDTTAFVSANYNPIDNALINITGKLTYSDEAIYLTSLDTSSDIFNADHRTERLSFSLENESVFDTGALNHLVTTGVEIGRRTRTSISDTGENSTSAPGGTDEYVAAYITDRIQYGALTLTPQLRYETQTLTSQGNTSVGIADGTTFKDDAVVGALSARYAFNDNWAVFGSVAYNENLPILDDLTNPGFIVQSEKGVTYEAGLSFDAFDVFADADALKTKVTAFTTNIWDGTTYSGVDQVDLDGVEFELSYAHPAFYADFNAAVIRGTINDTSADFNWAPADSVQLTLGKRFMGDQLDISLETTHGFAQNRTSGTSGATAPSASFTTYDLSASYTPDSGWAKGVEFRAAVENLTDETYRPYLSTRNAPGRNLKLSISKVF